MKICAVVVTYNRSSLMKECISALENQKGLSGIIVVNNASTDDTKKVLEQMSNDIVHAFHLNENTGGAGGFHFGLNKSVELGFDASWIMDDDAIPLNGSLNELIAAAEHLKWSFGFLTSNVQTDDSECMNVPSIDLSPNKTGYADWAKHSDQGLIKVKMATFVSVLVKNSTVIELGLPIKEMFIWGDDSEYTQRISKVYESYFVSKSKVIHKRVLANSLSILNENDVKRVLWFKLLYRNNFYRLRMHGSKADILKYITSLLLVFFKVLSSDSPMKIKRLQALMKGFFLGVSFNPKVTYPKF